MDIQKLKELALTFPDFEWDTTESPFLNGPDSGEAAAFAVVYYPDFEVDGEFESVEGSELIESCPVEIAKFICESKAGILDLIAENERLSNNRDMWKGQSERQAVELDRLRQSANKEVQL